MAAHIGGVRLARSMLTSPPLGNYYRGEFEPGADKTSDAQIESWLRANATSDNHETGTLAMMPQDLGGVVDTNLLVYGTQNIRVAGWFIFDMTYFTLLTLKYRRVYNPVSG